MKLQTQFTVPKKVMKVIDYDSKIQTLKKKFKKNLHRLSI